MCMRRLGHREHCTRWFYVGIATTLVNDQEVTWWEADGHSSCLLSLLLTCYMENLEPESTTALTSLPVFTGAPRRKWSS